MSGACATTGISYTSSFDNSDRPVHMRSWTFSLAVDRTGKTPLFVQIAREIAGDIARGRLAKGDALPGTRTLAETLGVHRTTVVAAYEELAAQGWTSTRPGGATRVATTSPD